MAQWNFNQAGVTFNKAGYEYNFLPVATIKLYYTGFFHTTKALLRRGLGF